MEFQDREGRNDSLKLEFENYLKREKMKKRKKTKGQPPLAPQLGAPEAELLEIIDSAISENNYNQASGKRHTSTPPAGLTSLPESIKWIARGCTNPHYVRCLYGDQDIVHEILHEAQGKGDRKYHVKWKDTIVLRKYLDMFEKEGYKTESQRPLADDEYISLSNREQWIVASWKPTYEPADSIGNSEQIQQLLAEMKANLKPSQQELGPARRDADLTDDRQIQGKWIDSSHRCAHPILQEPRLRDLIKLDPMTRVNPDKDVQPTGQFEICDASETMGAIYSPEGAFLGSMRKKRIETLAQAYRKEVGDFPQAIAKLIARYKDGSKAGTHTFAYRNCYTAPPSLTTAHGRGQSVMTGSMLLVLEFITQQEEFLTPSTPEDLVPQTLSHALSLPQSPPSSNS